jgi:OOP family OmpA-OmpF porin
MRSLIQPVCALASAGMLSACGITAATLGEPEPRGDPFADALAADYARLTEKETSFYDWRDADWFAVKAESASAGERVMPEEIEDRDLPEAHVDEARQRREQLMAVLRDDGSEEPQAAALAQTGFDCWIEEQEENFQPDMIAACDQQFETAMADLVAVRQAAAAEVEPAAAPPEPREYVLYFAFDQATLDDEAETTLQEAIDAAREMELGQILIAGHADRAGPDPHNERLSEQRAQNVAAGFEQAGFDPTVRAFGESEPAVPTDDGVPEQENRRAVIRLE